MSGDRSVFVTVGTTEFNSLVESVVQSEFLKLLCFKGYTKMIIQKGNGTFTPKEGVKHGVSIEVFRYKDNIVLDFKNADLVISHAGAGSCFEALELDKPLIAVINDSLMNNHQFELAEALQEEGFCKYCYIDTLWSTFQEFDSSSLTSYKPGKPEKLVQYIDSVFHLKK